MKRIFTLCIVLCTVLTGFAQTDTTGKPSDTIKVGTMIIIRKPGNNNNESKRDKHIIISNNNRHYKPSNISTNWIILDLGFANYNDKTNFADAAATGFIRNGVSDKDNFKLKTIKSVNVNIWLFMQRLSLYKGVVNLKYGFGMQMYNYYYKTNIVYVDGANVYVKRDSIDYGKNKLATDYFTVPLMLNFNTDPSRGNRALNFSVGVSAGYMYSSRQKLKVGDNKDKHKSNFNLDPWKVDYVAEVGLGIVHLFGSYNISALHKTALKQYPYAVGIRLGGWD